MRTDILSNPRFIGFADIFKNLETEIRAGLDAKELAYPPCDIIEINETTWEVRLALAGFKREELLIEVQEGNVLSISGQHDASIKQGDETIIVKYLHRGISSKRFARQFRIVEGTNVESASFENGILSVKLFREVKVPKVQQINIA